MRLYFARSILAAALFQLPFDHAALGQTSERVEFHTLEEEPPRFEFLRRTEFEGALDIEADAGFENPTAEVGRIKVRNIEMSAVSALAEGLQSVITIGGHEESGRLDLLVHEAYMEYAVPLGGVARAVSLKVGRFPLNFGILNSTTSSDWAFTTAPQVQTQFLAREGVIDNGIEIDFDLWKFGDTKLKFQGGITNGWTFDHTQTSGRRPLAPTHYLHPLLDFSDGSNVRELGFNYLARTDADSTRTQIVGADLFFESKAFDVRDWLLQSEAYHRLQTSRFAAMGEDLGGYAYFEKALNPAGKFFGGLRLDASTNLSLTSSSGRNRYNFNYGAVPTVTYRTTDQTRVQFSYSYLCETREGDANRIEQIAYLQLLTTMGGQ